MIMPDKVDRRKVTYIFSVRQIVKRTQPLTPFRITRARIKTSIFFIQMDIKWVQVVEIWFFKSRGKCFNITDTERLTITSAYPHILHQWKSMVMD